MLCEQVMTPFMPMPLPPLAERPLVSVIISSYNYGRFLRQTVESVLAQTYPHFEVIICDDGSTDDSRQVIDCCVQQDPRVRALYKPNGGQASALNVAYEHASGEIICLLDSDDLFNPWKLEAVVQAFAEHPTGGFCHHPLLPISKPNHPIRRPFPLGLDSGWQGDEALRRGGWGKWAPTSGICLRRGLADRLFPIPECFGPGFGDAYIASEAQFLTELIVVPDVLGQYRAHSTNGNGFLRPTTQTVIAAADFAEIIFSNVQAFVAATYGDEIAQRLRIDDLPTWYWDNLLTIYILDGKPNGGVRGYSVESILRHYDERGKRFWRCLLTLPPDVAWRFLQFWWGGKPWWGAKMALVQALERASKRSFLPTPYLPDPGISDTQIVDPLPNPNNGATPQKLAPLALPPLPHEPLVSVIISNYNYAQFLGEAIESVLAQTYPHFEVIICDDGSTDDSRQVIESYTQHDRRVRALYKTNGGQASTWNLAYEDARGEIICFLDSDDLFDKRKLEAVVAAFATHPTGAFCHHRLVSVGKAGQSIGRSFPPVLDGGWTANDALGKGGWGNRAPSSGIVLRRELANRLFPIPECFRFGGADAYIAGTAGFLTEFIALPDILARYRVHGANSFGVGRPTACSVSLNADSIELIFLKVQAFVAATCGDEVAQRLRIDDLPTWYWSNLLALYILDGKPDAGVRGYSVESMLRRYDGSKKHVWRCLLTLPPDVAWRFLQFWWGGKPWWGAKMALVQALERASKRSFLPTPYLPDPGISDTQIVDPLPNPNNGATPQKLAPLALPPLPHEPLVSVLIANYNYATYIAEAIESALNQTYPNLEVIVADDGSTDDSCAIVERYAQQDTRVKVLRERHRGNGAALNAAFAASNGQVLCLLDSDDLFTLDRVEKIVNHFKAHPNIGLVVHPLMIVDRFGHTVHPLRFQTRIEHGWIADRVIRRGGRWANMPGGGTCFRRDVAKRIFPIPEDTFPIYGDGFIYTVGPLLTEVSALSEPLYKCRVHGQNTYGSLKRDTNWARKEMHGIALQVAETNRRLETLGFGTNVLDISRNLNYRQQRLSLFLFEGEPRHIVMKEYAAVARAFLQDDLYVPGQKLIRLLVYGLAVLMPGGWRSRWLIAAGSRNRLRPHIENGLNRLGMLSR